MKHIAFAVFVAATLASVQASASELVTIDYAAAELGAGRWEYTYQVTNQGLLEPIREFTIWFKHGKYENLSVTTGNPPAGQWDEIVVQPDPYLPDDGFYDALELAGGIALGESVSGFSVAFDWADAKPPGPQLFDVVDPDTFDTIFSGQTVPEPASGPLLVLLAVLGRRFLHRR